VSIFLWTWSFVKRFLCHRSNNSNLSIFFSFCFMHWPKKWLSCHVKTKYNRSPNDKNTVTRLCKTHVSLLLLVCRQLYNELKTAMDQKEIKKRKGSCWRKFTIKKEWVKLDVWPSGMRLVSRDPSLKAGHGKPWTRSLILACFQMQYSYC